MVTLKRASLWSGRNVWVCNLTGEDVIVYLKHEFSNRESSLEVSVLHGPFFPGTQEQTARVIAGQEAMFDLGRSKFATLRAHLERDPHFVICMGLLIPRGFKAILQPPLVPLPQEGPTLGSWTRPQALQAQRTGLNMVQPDSGLPSEDMLAAHGSKKPSGGAGSHVGADLGTKSPSGNPGGVVSDAANYKDSLGV
jgi:hypothetical protein